MQWKKLGQIFNPADHRLPNDCFSYAQAPQALVFDDFVRIYFSTRALDSLGKPVSHIAFIDMDKQFSNIKYISAHTVIPLGELGAYDEHGIFPLNVVRDGDWILGFICGLNRRVSVPLDSAIGLAISHDNGRTFVRIGPGPVMASSLHDPFLVADPFVSKIGSVFHCWYIFGTAWILSPGRTDPDRVYKIGHAISEDAINWRRDGRQIIEDRLHANECQALPTVIEINGRYHMWFCYRQPAGFREERRYSYRIGYAFSEDLIKWTRDDDRVGIDTSTDGWDSDMLCYPHVFRCDDNIYMLYNGNEFGRFGFGLAVLEQM